MDAGNGISPHETRGAGEIFPCFWCGCNQMSDNAQASGRGRAALAALGAVFASPPLRRLQLAWAGSILGGWAYLVALGVYAYDQGGAAAVGIVGLIRLVPAALAAPFTSSLVDRFSLMLVAAAVIAADGPGAVVYATVAVSQVVGTVFRPAQSALLPGLVRT